MSKRKAPADLIDRRKICLICEHRHAQRARCDHCPCLGRYGAKPCLYCEHRHVKYEYCPRLDCDCPGSEEWFDWVVVELALAERHDEIGRSMSLAERTAVIQRLAAKGASIGDVMRLAKVNLDTAKKRLAEANHGTEPENARQGRLAV